MQFFINAKRPVSVEGLMTIGKLENGMHTADFTCTDDVQLKPYCGKCKMQVMRDGNVYITELPRRIRNKPIFRDDNCTLTLGRDGRWYFNFSLNDAELEELPEKLMQQAGAISQKVLREILSTMK